MVRGISRVFMGEVKPTPSAFKWASLRHQKAVKARACKDDGIERMRCCSFDVRVWVKKLLLISMGETLSESIPQIV
jgi:hypothetical protein